MSETNLPNFLIVGAAKCGTTSLHAYLKQHPDVFMSAQKEPDHFMSRVVKVPTGGPGDDRVPVIQDFEQYKALFAGSGGRSAIGEASHTSLYYHDLVIPHIRETLGDPRILVILRNPVERAFSAYSHLKLQGRETLDFEEGLEREAQRVRDNFRSMWFYRRAGLYAEAIRDYQIHFSQVKICFSQDLMKDPLGVVQDVFRFLGVDPTFTPDVEKQYNPSGEMRFEPLRFLFKKQDRVLHAVRRAVTLFMPEDRWVDLRDDLKARLLVKPQMRPETRRELAGYFQDDVAAVAEMTGRDLGSWLKERKRHGQG